VRVSIQERLDRHVTFWKRADVDRPLVGFTIGSYFPVHRFAAARDILQAKTAVTAEMLRVQAYLEDYERLYQLSLAVDQDLFWVAEPFTGIPWLEAICGCRISASSDSFWAEHWLDDLSAFPDRIALEDNPWFQKYMEFVHLLVRHSRGRFAVGQPIFRGPVDVLAALRGHQQAVMDFLEETRQVERVLNVLAATFMEVVRRHQQTVPALHGGYGIGFYYLWAPGRVVWLQEDASALLNPGIYRRQVFPFDRKIAAAYPYSLFHLHPASLFILDHLLEMDSLKIVQINKDVGGPSISQMMPKFQAVLERKCLVIWGDLSAEEIEEIVCGLPARGLALNIVVSNPEQANFLMEVVRQKSTKNTNTKTRKHEISESTKS
jgi:hypothetical protein